MKLPIQIVYSRWLLALIAGLFCASLSWFKLVQPLDLNFYDLFNETSAMPPAEDVVIVAIDERSLQELGRWPWPREKHVELLRQLKAAEVAAIAMDILLVEADTDYPEVDTLLARVISDQGAVVLPVFIAQDGRGAPLREILPIAPIASGAAALGHVHIDVDSDGVARRVFLREGVGEAHWPHFSAALATLIGATPATLPGVIDPAPKQHSVNSRIVRNYENLVPFMGDDGTVERVSYVDVMRGRTTPETFRGRIVFIGATAAGHVDNITTSLGQIPGVEVNVNIFQALRTGRLASPVPAAVAGLVIFLITAGTILLFTGLTPRLLLLSILASAILLPLASFLLFHFFRLWLSPAPAVLTLFIAYPLWNWLRLDAAVNFISRQLEKLEQDNRRLAPVPDWSDIERAAEFLRSLGHLANWQWRSEVPTTASAPASERWLHEGATSSRQFTLEGSTRRLCIDWKPGHEYVAETVQQIFPDPRGANLLPGSGADVIDINLLALDEAYAQARRNRELVSGTLEQLESAVILSELSGEILLINEQARDLLGIVGECTELLQALGGIALQEALDIGELVNQLIFRDMHFDHEGTAIATGREILCRGGVIKLDRPMLLIVMMDVAELKRSEKRRTEALNFLSHDLRAPLTSVLALIESSRVEQAAGQDQALLTQIESYIEKNLSYAENFIQLAKLEHDDSLNHEECDASSLIDNAVAQVFHLARKRAVALNISCCEEPVWLNCNRSMLERALMNLIDNALKQSSGGDAIAVELDCDDTQAIFRVSDQGEGISDGDMERIFSNFRQGTSTRGGVGLGLRFVSAVASNHGGAIAVANITGGGACFTLKIPR